MKMLQSCLASMLLLSSGAFAQDITRESLELPGCGIQDLAAGNDPSAENFIILAACNSPFGIQYARSFGGEWVLGTGGDYSVGIAREVAVTSEGLYAVVQNALLHSDLPTSSTSFTPNWSAVAGYESVNEIHAVGKFLVILKGADIDIYDTDTNSVVTTVDFPTMASGTSKVRTGPDYMYVLAIPDGSPNEALYRRDFDPSTGASPGSWTNLSGATGLTYDSTDDIWNYFVNPVNGDVFLGIRIQPEFTDLMYRSTDDGASYTSTGETIVANQMSFSADGVTIIMGNSASTDGGSNWTTLSRGTDGMNESDGRLEDGASIINQTDSTQALHSTNEGVDLTNDLDAMNPTWSQASTGLQGTQVYVISQSETNSNRVVLGTSGGVAVTDNFNDASVTWTFPLCPGNDCVGGGNVFIDPTNDNQIYYGSGNIRRCDISDPANISCNSFANKPNDFVSFSVFTMFPELPDTVVAGYVRTEGAVDGGLYFYNVDDPSSPVSATDLAGIPVSAFIPLDANTMFAAAGANTLEDAAYRGIYLSTDGGTNFTEMSDSELGAEILVNAFAYDATRDVLFAATGPSGSTSGTIVYLESALAGGTDWVATTTTFSNANFTAIVVDSDSGTIYASSAEEVYRSTDGGVTFSLEFTGSEGESTSDLELTEGEATEGAVVGIAAANSRLVQATSTGIYALEEESSLSCFLRIKGCGRKTEAGSRCTFVVRAVDQDTSQGVVGTFQLQRQKSENSSFVNYGRASSTGQNGKKSLIKKAKKGTYRAVFSEPAECTSASKTIRIKK